LPFASGNLELLKIKRMTQRQKPRKSKDPVSEDSKIEKIINQRDTANKGLEKILKKMNEKSENKQ
jgi:hypothetical protein